LIASCTGNLRHGNRMYDSAHLYFQKANVAINESIRLIPINRSKSDSFYNAANKYGEIARMYGDSMHYYHSKRFELGGNP